MRRDDITMAGRTLKSIDFHKGQTRLVLVAEGSEDYVCAPALVAYAASRVGCDMVMTTMHYIARKEAMT